MTVRKQNARASTLAVVIGQVRDAFDAVGDPTPIRVGKKFLEEGGVPPQVVFVPEDGSGSISTPSRLGQAASQTHSCLVNVRAPETGDDLDRMLLTYALQDRVISFLAVAGAGRITFGSVEDSSPSDVDVFGAGLSFRFTYSRDIAHDAQRWALPPATSDTSLAEPAPPPGTPADGVKPLVSVVQL